MDIASSIQLEEYLAVMSDDSEPPADPEHLDTGRDLA